MQAQPAAGEVQLRDVDLAVDAVALRDQRVDLTDHAELFAVDDNIGAAARMIARVLRVGDIRRRMHVQLFEQRVDLPLSVKKFSCSPYVPKIMRFGSSGSFWPSTGR